MARTVHSLGLTLLWILACAGAAAAPASPQDSCDEPIKLDAASTVFDNKSNSVSFKDIVITQCDIRVKADRARATGLKFDDTKWTFEGNVWIQSEQRGDLHSDQAVVEFRNNRVARATVDGTPAQFEQKRSDSDQVTHGHAGEIVYDIAEGTVRLSRDAWLSDGRNEISSALLVYNIREQKIQGSTPPGTDGRVHITITPNGKPGSGGKP